MKRMFTLFLLVVVAVPVFADFQAGHVFQDCSACPEMVVVPAGSFQMGSNTGEKDEQPVHPVRIERAFALGKTEVTLAQFTHFVEATAYRTDAEEDAGELKGCKILQYGKWEYMARRNYRSPGFAQLASQPAACISFNDASAYIAWLRKTTGKRYRLPSEAEWEYAARSGSTTDFFWGNNSAHGCQFGNGADQTESPSGKYNWSEEARAQCIDGYWFTAPVASFKLNAFGLYDMHGNVFEWTADCWNESYQGAPTNEVAWSQGDCGKRVVRGASWYDIPSRLRSADRYKFDTANRSYSGGFRIARDL